MTTKKDTLNPEEKFFLNLDDDLTLDVPYKDFVFSMKAPSLTAEAALSLTTVKMAQEVLRFPEYEDIVSSITIPRLEDKEPTEEDKSTTRIVEDPLDLNRVQHVRMALNFLPQEFVTSLVNIAYLQTIVTDITYQGKPVWIKNEQTGEEIHVNSFLKFIKYIRSRRIRHAELVETLGNAFSDWMEATEVDPQEVKN